MKRRCLNCNAPIATCGEELLHIAPIAETPLIADGTAWRECRGLVATEAPSRNWLAPTRGDSQEQFLRDRELIRKSSRLDVDPLRFAGS